MLNKIIAQNSEVESPSKIGFSSAMKTPWNSTMPVIQLSSVFGDGAERELLEKANQFMQRLFDLDPNRSISLETGTIPSIFVRWKHSLEKKGVLLAGELRSVVMAHYFDTKQGSLRYHLWSAIKDKVDVLWFKVLDRPWISWVANDAKSLSHTTSYCSMGTIVIHPGHKQSVGTSVHELTHALRGSVFKGETDLYLASTMHVAYNLLHGESVYDGYSKEAFERGKQYLLRYISGEVQHNSNPYVRYISDLLMGEHVKESYDTGTFVGGIIAGMMEAQYSFEEVKLLIQLLANEYSLNESLDRLNG